MTYTTEERKQRVDKYFIKTPDKPNYAEYVSVVVVGLIMMIWGYSTGGLGGWFVLMIGLTILIKSLQRAYKVWEQYSNEFKKAEPKANDKGMDYMLNKGYLMIQVIARQRLDIDEEDTSAEPFVIYGPAYKSPIIDGKDGKWRSKQYDFLWLFLTDHKIATFKCIFDMGKGEILQDSIKEFPIKDITNLEIENTNNFHQQSQKIVIQTLNLYTSGGNKISVNYIFGNGTSPAENTIKAIRKRLKEYSDKFSGGMQPG